MITRFALTTILAALVLIPVINSPVAAQTGVGYGVNAGGQLFRFNIDSPNDAVTPIGNLGFVPEGIDFRPTTTPGDPNRPLYAIDIGAVTTQLYTVSTVNGAATAVGTGFPSTVAGSYDLTTSNLFGFDFNPTTLQGDGSIRIRLISANGGVNLRLNSDTGLVAAVDTPLLYANQNSPFADGAAYINSNRATAGGTTTLFDMDSRPDVLSIQNPPNAGTLNVVGPFGLTIDATPGIGFDVLTDANDADPSIGGDRAYAVYRRPDAPIGGPFNQWIFYNVNLATGDTTGGLLVGISGGNPSADFTGGMALTYVPEPSSLVIGLASMAAAMSTFGRRRIAG